MSFANPYLALLALPLYFAAWRMLRRARNRGVAFSAMHRLPHGRRNWRMALAALVPYLLVASLALLTAAAMRPRTPLARSARTVDAIAIAMTVDVSGSMDALDLAPEGTTAFTREMTRLAVVKKLFAEFVARRPDDLIGLITFGGYAATRVPLTADHAALLEVLKGVEIPSIAVDANGRAIAEDEQMTAIGDGLATALLRLKNMELKSKVVILLSDGVSNAGAVSPEEAAKAAAEMGVKVYAIGVGTGNRRTPIIQRDFFGREVVRYADTTFDEAQLKSIAETTGGMYFAVNDKASLQRALDEIDALETTRLDTFAYTRWRERFPVLLLLGAVLAAIAVSLSMAATRRPM